MTQKKKDNKEGAGVGLKDREKNKIQRPRKFKVVFMNDDYTPMDFVAALLVEVFHKSVEDAKVITMSVHKQGKGIAGVYSREIAETKAIKSVQIARNSGHPLLIQAEPE